MKRFVSLGAAMMVGAVVAREQKNYKFETPAHPFLE
jgi:hypothetical protein